MLMSPHGYGQAIVASTRKLRWQVFNQQCFGVDVVKAKGFHSLQAEEFRELGKGKNVLADGQSAARLLSNHIECITKTRC